MLEVTADYGLYLGNAYVARALDAWFDPGATSLSQEIAQLDQAERIFVGGLHGQELAAPIAMLDPFHVGTLAGFSTQALAGNQGSAFRLKAVNADSDNRASGEPIRRALRALDAALFAASQRSDRQRRAGDDGAAATSVREAAVRTWIDLAALSPALSTGGYWAADVGAVVKGLSEATRRFAWIAQGRNLFGYAPGYVPFLWNKDAPGTNHVQIRTNAQANQANAHTLYTEAQSARRQYEVTASALSTELSSELATIDAELTALCGTAVTDLSRCGADAGESNASQVAQQLLEIRAATLRVAGAEQQMANVTTGIRIEEDRAAAVAQVRENHAVFIKRTGERIYALQKALRQIEAARSAAHGFLGSITSALTHPDRAVPLLVAGAAQAAVDGVAYLAGEGRQAKIAELQALEQAEVEYVAMRVELIDSAAKVKTELLQLLTLDLDHDVAVTNLAQAMGRLRGLHDRAAVLLADKARVSALTRDKARYALHHRVYADARARAAADALEDARAWSDLATRALEYQLVETYGSRADLWQVRDPNGITSYLTGLQNWAAKAPTAQPNRDVISLRDDLLGMGKARIDPVTGVTLSPREQFRRFVADPANRDLDGNLHVYFSTDNPAQPVFSSSIASDRIRTVSVNLIGDALGAGVTSAYVRLVHGGTSQLRSRLRGTDGTAPLVAYDMTAAGNRPTVAHVHAGINGMAGGAAPEQNVELQDRAILAGPWELVIDTTAAEPANARLNVLGLDDIELTFVHDSYTIQ